MVEYLKYTQSPKAGFTERDRFTRAYRETFLFELINHFDRIATDAENAAGIPDSATELVSFEAKRRARNQIFSAAKQYVDEYNATRDPDVDPISVDDPSVLSEVFFETPFGSQYKRFADSWKKGNKDFDRLDMLARQWTVNVPGDAVRFPNKDDRPGLRVTISPYDPMFASSDLFDDEHDNIGYITDGGCLTSDLRYIKSVHLGRDRVLVPVDSREDFDRAKRMFPDSFDLEGIDVQSGYSIVSRYIKERNVQDRVRSYLRGLMGVTADRMQPSNPGPSEDEKEYMRQACDYLSRLGYDFNIDVGAGNTLIATLADGNRTEIRLLSPEDRMYQGRIYSQGLVTRIGLPNTSGMTEDVQNAYVRAEDRMAMLRWEMGERVPFINSVDRPAEPNAVATTRPSNPFFGKYVGEMYDVPIVVRRKSTGNQEYNPVAMGKQQSAGNSIAVGLKASADSKGAPYKEFVVNIIKDCATIKTSDFDKLRQWVTDADLPEDFFEDPQSYATPEGNRKGLTFHINRNKLLAGDSVVGFARDASGTVTTDKNYYRHLVIRDRLVELLDSAKESHASKVNIPAMTEAIKTALHNIQWSDEERRRSTVVSSKIQSALNDIKFPFSDDPDVKEVQELCWNEITRLPDGELLQASDGVDRDEALAESLFSWYEDSAVDARVAELTSPSGSLDEDYLSKHFVYSRYVDEHFGYFPEIRRPNVVGDPVDVPENHFGYDPGVSISMLCQYANREGVMNPGQVSENVERLMMMLEDDYSPEFLKVGDYSSDDLRDRLIRFDPDNVVATVTLPSLYVGDADGATTQIDWSRLESVEGLEDKPFTRQMLQKAMEGLLRSGCYSESIGVRIDSRGIIEYMGVATTSKMVSSNTADHRNRKPSYIDVLGLVDKEREEAGKGGASLPTVSFEPGRSLTGRECADHDLKKIHGYIGQVFEPDLYGAIHLDTETPRDRVIVPGYNAYLVPQDPDNPLPMRDRLRLIGIETMLGNQVLRAVRSDAFSLANESRYISHTADLNGVYSKVYDMAFDREDYDARVPKDPEHMTPDEKTFVDTIRTLRGRCRFPNEYGDGSTTMAQSYLEHPNETESKGFDYYYSDLCDNWNLRVLGPQFDGIFDGDMTGTAKTQGIVRYLVDGAKVDPNTGTVEPGMPDLDDTEARCPIMKDPLFRNKDHDSWDRRLMAGSQIVSALGVIRNTGTAMMTLQGLNMDDGMVISRAVAEAYPQKGADGTVRPLMMQDKLSDFHGNKGVISKVIDPALYSGNIREAMLAACGDGTKPPVSGMMSRYPFELRALDDTPVNSSDIYDMRQRDFLVHYNGKSYPVRFPTGSNKLTPEVRMKTVVDTLQKAEGYENLDPTLRLFHENPDLGVVMAPYSGQSRSNGGSVCDMMFNEEKKPGTLIVNGKPIEGGMGYTNFIIVDMLADVKTHWYDEKAVMEGRGRKASGQLAWALQSKKAFHIMREFYGRNMSAINDLREYALAVGFDFDEQLRPVVGYHPQANGAEKRNLLKLPDVNALMSNPEMVGQAAEGKEPTVFVTKRDAISTTVKGSVLNACRDRCLDMMKDFGGFMELPFPLTFNGVRRVGVDLDEKPDLKAQFTTPMTGQSAKIGDKEIPTYGLPLLSAHLRNGQEFEDGTSIVHEYTTKYLGIHKCAVSYMVCRAAYDKEPEGSERREALLREMETKQQDAQRMLDDLTGNIISRRFDTKHNVIRDSLMASRLRGSATAVWSADPRLNLDEVAMSSEHARTLGLLDENGKFKKGMNYVVVWRDPILHDDNVRYMKVHLDDTVDAGVTINPMMAKCFDGDFDGDSVAIVALHSMESRIEAENKFSVAHNLVQKGVVLTNEDGEVLRDGKGRALHPLYLQTGLDVQANMYSNPALREEYDRLTIDANMLTFQLEDLSEELTKHHAALAAERHGGEKVSDEEKQRIADMQAVYNASQRSLMGRLNAWSKFVTAGVATTPFYEEMKEVADPSVGTDHLILHNNRAFVQSVQHIVEDGAKGNASKMKEFMHNVGIDYQTDENGVPQMSTVRSIRDDDGRVCSMDTKNGRQREVDRAIQETTAYKADNTALGGTSAQNGVAAFRDVSLTEVLELTYPITQAILQSKHDPKDAKIKDEIVRFWGKDVWNGYKLTGNFTGSPEEIQGSSHKRILCKRNDDDRRMPTYVSCTVSEWKTQMLGMMKALKVDINPDYIDKLATAMSREPDPEKGEKGSEPRVLGFQAFADKAGSFLDAMAYRGRFRAFVDATISMRPGASKGSVLKDAGDCALRVQEVQRAIYEYQRDVGNRDELTMLRYDMTDAIRQYKPSASFIPLGLEKNLAAQSRGEEVKPFGDTACFVSEESLAKGFGIMGESPTEMYERLKLQQMKESAEPVVSVTTSGREKVDNPFWSEPVREEQTESPRG